ncbi:MAG TPA: hypothetical protein VN611_05400 [Patescibacteria group bacterium]|nr:hypothetical protein [Patescibacteria group bacterium]
MEQQNELNIVRASRNGLTTGKFIRVDGRDFYLHSQYDPAEEAKLLMEHLPIQEQTLYVLVGFGLGYHVQVLLNKIPESSCVAVIESATEKFSEMIRDQCRKNWDLWMEDHRLLLFSMESPAGLLPQLAEIYAQHRLTEVKYFTHIPSTMTNEGFYFLVQQNLARFSDFLIRRAETAGEGLQREVCRYWDNLPVAWKTAPLDAIIGCWQNQPLLLVDRQMPAEILSQLQNMATPPAIMATVGALRELKQYGIRPAAVLALDDCPMTAGEEPDAEWRQLPLLFDLSVPAGWLDWFQGPRFWCSVGWRQKLPLTQDAPVGTFPRGMTVAAAAVSIARVTGANPVLMAGNGFAIMPEDADERGDDRLGDAEKHSVPLSYERFVEWQVLQESLRQKNAPRYILLAQQGAGIKGAVMVPPDRLPEYLQSTGEETLEQRLVATFAAHTPPRRKDILELLRAWEKQLQQFLTVAPSLDDTGTYNRFQNLDVFFLNQIIYRDWIHFAATTEVSRDLTQHGEYLLRAVQKMKKIWS